MIRRLAGLGLVLLLLACSRTPGEGPPAARAGRRVLSLAPNLTETVFALGQGDRVVAVTANDHDPPEVERLPRVGDMQPDLERILALKPDLVLLDRNLHPPELEARLQALGLPLVAVETRSLGDLQRNLPVLGRALGAEEEARRALEAFQAGLREVERKAASMPHHPRVFVEIWGEPLMTAGAGSLVHELVEKAGGRNVYGDLPEAWPTLSTEDLVRRDPDLVVLTSTEPAVAAARPGWSRLQAVRKGRLYRVDPDLVVRPTLRALEGLRQLQARFQEAAP